MKKQNLYIIVWRDDDGTNVGYLPFGQIPTRSILWKYIKNGVKYITLQDGGVLGVYNDKKLAQEHLRIEKKWRCADRFEINTIKSDNGR